MTAEAAGPHRFVDLSPSARDVERLAAFYEGLYVAEFPDPDEREALANMVYYLEHDGSHGNAYLVTLVYDGETVVAGSIADYFVRSNCGAIEFLTVAPGARGRGLGAALARHVEARMAAAAAARDRSLALVMAEMNDPFKRTGTPDNLDPFERLRFWHRLGYRRAAFPYVQPALSPAQSPVTNLLLAAKPVDAGLARAVPAEHVIAFLRDYLVYAMRFDDPAASPEFVAMADYLGRHPAVPLAAFDAYTGDDPHRPLFVAAVERPDDPDFAAAMAIYRRAFADPALAVEESTFASLLALERDGARYHLWALRAQSGGPVSGIVSFFALEQAGFGGYLALEAPLLHAGRLRLILARIEQQLVRDAAASGWYIECAGDDGRARFEQCGFSTVALPWQPAPGRPLRLLYKELGPAFEPPRLSKAQFLGAMRAIASAVYGIDRPDGAPPFAELAHAVAALPGDTIPFEPSR